MEGIQMSCCGENNYSQTICSTGPVRAQPCLGPYFAQYASGNLGACASVPAGFQLSKAGRSTPVGCAEQYWRLPGFAKYC
eukprot:m.338104 g.338104  ORF g.338104 m.338104 type:complete len:80 (+) comp18315_c0_seq1:126-365(+)